MKKSLLILVMGFYMILISSIMAPAPAFAQKTRAGEAKDAMKGKSLLTGVFGGPVQGLEYKTPTISGITNDQGEFKYGPGEVVTFSVGGLVLGASPARDLVTPAHLAVEVAGDAMKLRNQKVTNIARLVQSLDSDTATG